VSHVLDLAGQALGPAAGALACWWGYRRRSRTLARQGRPVPGWRAACFAAGLALAVVALAPPLDELSRELLVAHMAQHLLLADLGALLIVLGLTGPLLAPLLSLPVLGRLRALSHPVAAFSLWTLDLYAWHLPPLYQAAVRHDAIHLLEHGMFLFLGINMWMALLGPLPKPDWFGNLGRLGYVVGVRMAGAALANALLWSGVVLYPVYAATAARRGTSALEDQSLAGSLMMVEGSLVTIGLFAWLFLRAARDSEERQRLVELAAARGVAVSERRVARAVAAGRGDELRARIEEGRAAEAPASDASSPGSRRAGPAARA
jgi:cytochrome c oxidase assembly factor CtaG